MIIVEFLIHKSLADENPIIVPRERTFVEHTLILSDS
jgi:hypothetical protein